MKLYTLIEEQTGRVLAISESKSDMVQYMKSKDMREGYFYVKVTKQHHIDDLMFTYDDLYLENDVFLDNVFTRIELKMIDDIIDEEKERLKMSVKDLEHYIANYSLSKKDKKTLAKAHTILQSSKKKKKLKKVLDLQAFIGFVGKSKTVVDVFRDKLHETQTRLYVFINTGNDD